MKFEDIKRALKELWSEFRLVKSGLVGLVFLVAFVLTVVLEPIVSPEYKANTEWRNITFWEDNPRSVPPVWVDLFTTENHARSLTLNPVQTEKGVSGEKMAFEYEYDYHYPPQDIFIHFDSTGTTEFSFSVERPDGIVIPLFNNAQTSDKSKHIRLSADKDGKLKAYNFLKRADREARNVSRDLINTFDIVFSEKNKEMYSDPAPLQGTYKFIVETSLESGSSIENVYMNVAGSVYGFMGTDSSKRDIWSGLIGGVKWALLIGLLTAIFAVSIGVILGVMAAFYGGWKDAAIMRVFEVVQSIPLLPVLIVISAVFKPSIYFLITLMGLFFWVGPVKTVRSMGLQIKEEVYIEASKALGASNFRIIFKHMIPLLIPYAFATMALYVPGAIVYESVISLLGLGDPSIVTWGQLLRDANANGAVISGQWWWIVPPGIGIALMGMTFAFVGFAMDKILHPKLRTR